MPAVEFEEDEFPAVAAAAASSLEEELEEEAPLAALTALLAL